MNKVDIYINDQRLDVFQDEEITINLSVQNVQDISKTFTDFTQGFTVPATATNNAIFGYYYRSDITGSIDGRLRQPARIEINSLPFRTGVIEIENVQLKGTEPYAYTMTFYGDVVNLTDLFGDDYLYDLDFSAYDHSYTDEEVYQRFAFDFDPDFFYPLMSPVRNWIYNSSNSNHESTNIAYHTGEGHANVHGINYYELKPAMKVSAILYAIQQKYQITFTGDFLTSRQFLDLSLWLHRREGYMYENQPAAMAWEKVIADVDNAPANDIYQFNDDEFEPTISDVYNFSFTVSITSYTDDWQLAVIDTNGDQVVSQVTLNGGGSGAFAANLVAGRVYYFAVRPTTTATSPSFIYEFSSIIATRSGIVGQYINIEQVTNKTYGNTGFVYVSQQMPEIRVKDFLAGVVKMFNLVIVPDGASTFLLQPLNDWYNDGTDQDFQNFFDITEYTVNRPPLYREIEFKYQDTEQILGYQYKQINGIGYGDLRAFFNFDAEDFRVELPFECPLFERLTDQADDTLTNVLVYKSVTSEANEDGTFNPYVGAPVLFYAYYNDYDLAANPVSFIDSDGTTERIIEGCWYSNTSNRYSSAADSSTITFGADIDPYHLASVNSNLFNDYWSDYVSDLYSENRRILQIEAILPAGKIISMNLKNAIIWNNNKYLVNSLKVNMTTGKATFELLNVV